MATTGLGHEAYLKLAAIGLGALDEAAIAVADTKASELLALDAALVRPRRGREGALIASTIDVAQVAC